VDDGEDKIVIEGAPSYGFGGQAEEQPRLLERATEFVLLVRRWL
jgi:hypothetical protein